jgi:hypothetical protein
VVSADRAPQAGARVLFVSADRQGARHTVRTDVHGRFGVALASGGWLVYVQDSSGRVAFHKKFDVRANEATRMTLTSR